MTTQFYLPSDHIQGDRITLPRDEARHAAQVLRLREGDEIVAVDGEGGWYRIVLDAVGHRQCAGHVIERRREVGEARYRLRVGVGLVKQRSRFETFLEKAVELGVSEIVPLITARTEKERVREERSEKILTAAMKQCGRSRKPRLQEPRPLQALLRDAVGLGLFCHESDSAPLLGALREARFPAELTVLVGPEGGFSEEEATAAEANGYRRVSLGERRLRAETAAICAAAAVGLAYDAQ